ncbi:MAG: class IV adenylate cyclase [Candidatus Poribacteria bacterium]|nr:class IV adenylate cyclase [Candidatus Poribacteria bacterium]
MATNLEFKAHCESFENLYPRLADLKATHRETVHQTDTYFYVTHVKDAATLETCKPRLKLREISEARHRVTSQDETDEAWLIYYERPNHSESRYSQYQLSKVSDSSTLKTLLTVALGVETIVQKQREVWMFKNTRIHLDTVADLGQFIELETVFQGQTEVEAADEHQHVKRTLHLGAADPVAVSYSDLVMQKL